MNWLIDAGYILIGLSLIFYIGKIFIHCTFKKKEKKDSKTDQIYKKLKQLDNRLKVVEELMMYSSYDKKKITKEIKK